MCVCRSGMWPAWCLCRSPSVPGRVPPSFDLLSSRTSWRRWRRLGPSSPPGWRATGSASTGRGMASADHHPFGPEAAKRACLSLKALPQISELWGLVPHQEERDDPETGSSSPGGPVWGGEEPGGRLLLALWRPDCFRARLQDLQQRIQKHSEVETVDLVLKLKDKLVSVKRAELLSCMWGWENLQTASAPAAEPGGEGAPPGASRDSGQADGAHGGRHPVPPGGPAGHPPQAPHALTSSPVPGRWEEILADLWPLAFLLVFVSVKAFSSLLLVFNRSARHGYPGLLCPSRADVGRPNEQSQAAMSTTFSQRSGSAHTPSTSSTSAPAVAPRPAANRSFGSWSHELWKCCDESFYSVFLFWGFFNHSELLSGRFMEANPLLRMETWTGKVRISVAAFGWRRPQDQFQVFSFILKFTSNFLLNEKFYPWMFNVPV